jgi:hypothetical protein|tara:strand:- start:138 stop:443 length:306 start_codon:yes stop_codon:yes gene_type:complete
MDNIKDRYTFVTDNENPWTCIGVKGGKYEGVVYKYGKVTLPEQENEDGSLPFKFDYDIVDPNGLDRDFFGDDFVQLMGDILLDIIDDQMKEDKLEYLNTDN